MDLSGSMRAVFDGPPRPGKPPKETRFDVMKDAVLDVIANDPEGGKIGVVVFGERANTLVPPTSDHALVTKLVSKMKIGAVADNGSAFGDGVTMAVKQLEEERSFERVILLFADTENTGDGTQPPEAAEFARGGECRVLAIQVGEGGLVDVPEGNAPDGTPRYKRETFPAKPEQLREIASITGGAFVLAKTPAELLDATKALLR